VAFPETNFIFVCPPSITELKSRLVKRNTDSEAQLAVRLKNAVGEIDECLALWKMIQFRVLNVDLERATEEFVKIIETLYGGELGRSA
jgi:guanylate kinase